MRSLHFIHSLSVWIALCLPLLYAGIIISEQDNHYEQQILNCTEGESCDVFCQNPYACRQTTIHCPSGYECNVTCSDNYSCEDTIIYAQDSALFHLLDCASGRWTCVGISIHFPPNDHGQPKAFLIGGDRGFSAGQTKEQPLQFYGIYGWNDVHIAPSNNYRFDNHRGIMHCTTDYSVSCNFSETAWSCAAANHLCNDPPTTAPTISPTSDTMNPTYNPTYNPTINPTINPSTNPTTDLIITSTTILSAAPSHKPTVRLSTYPTYHPAQDTTIHSSTPHPSDPITSYSTLDSTASVSPTSNQVTALPTFSPSLLPTISPTSLSVTNTTTTSVRTTIFPTSHPSTSTVTAIIVSSPGPSAISVTKEQAVSLSSDTMVLHPLYIISIGLVVLLLCFVLLFVLWCHRRAHHKPKIYPTEAFVYNDKDSDHSDTGASSSLNTISEQGAIEKMDGFTETKQNVRIEIHPLKKTGKKENALSPLSPIRVNQGHNRAVSAASALSALSTLSAVSGVKSSSECETPTNDNIHKKQISTDLSHLRPTSFPMQTMRHQKTLSALSEISSIGYDAAGDNQQRVLSNTDTWEEQIRDLRNQWQNLQSISPRHEAPNIYDDVPSTAPAVMDHSVFFNQMVDKFNRQLPCDNVNGGDKKHGRDMMQSDFASDENSSSDSTTTTTSDTNSLFSDTRSTATSMTNSTASKTYRSRNRHKKHFRAPSVITEHLSDTEDSTDLPQLIEIDEREEMENDHDLNMIPELNEDEDEMRGGKYKKHLTVYNGSMASDDYDDDYDLSRSSQQTIDLSVTETQTTVSHNKHPTMEIRIDRISENDDDDDDDGDDDDSFSHHEMFALTKKDIEKSFNTDDEGNDSDDARDAHAYDHEYYEEYDQYED